MTQNGENMSKELFIYLNSGKWTNKDDNVIILHEISSKLTKAEVSVTTSQKTSTTI